MSNYNENAKNFRLTNNLPLDDYYGPYNTLAEAYAGVPSAMRANRTVGIIESGKLVEYVWHPDNVTNAGLVKKTSADNSNSSENSGLINSSSSDFILRLKNASKSRSALYVRYAGLGATDTLGIGINFSDGNTSEFFIRKDSSDLFLLRGGFVGRTILPYNTLVTLTGNGWVSLDLPQTYTRNIGDGFNFSFFGTGFYFNSYKDTRGGLWSFNIAEINQDIPISVWASNAPNTGSPIVSTTVIENLPLSNYTVTATFLGADPANAPSSTARGWLRRTVDGKESIGVYNPRGIIGSIKDKVIQEITIQEFAINGKAVEDTVSPNNWIPCHSTNTGATRNVITKIYADDIEIDIDNLISMPIFYGINKLTITQNYTAYNEDDVAGAYPVWEGVLTQAFTKEGLINTHSFKLLRDFTATAGYLSMFACNLEVCDKVMLGNSVGEISTPTVPSVTTNYDKIYDSVAFASTLKKCVASFKTNVVLATQIERRETKKGDMFMLNRDEGTGKMYWKLMNTTTVLKAGDTYRSETELFLAKVNDINI